MTKLYLLLMLLGPLATIAFAAGSRTDLKTVEGERFILDLKYNSENNFLKRNVYQEYRIDQCEVRAVLLAKLTQLTPSLERQKLKLVFFDCTRPLEVQRAMWKIVPDARFVANPKTGSNHNRGTAIDVGLAYEDGSRVPMPTEFDDFTSKAAAAYGCSPNEAQKCQNRDTLKKLMTEIGLVGLSTEWWHYQLPDAKKFPLVDSFNAQPD